MYFRILLGIFVAFVLMSEGICTKVSMNDPYVVRSMQAAARKYNARLVAGISAVGLGEFDIFHQHYAEYFVTIVIAAHLPKLPQFRICDAKAYWHRGVLYRVDIFYGCRPAPIPFPYNNNNNNNMYYKKTFLD